MDAWLFPPARLSCAPSTPTGRAPSSSWPSSLTFPLLLLVIITCFYWKLVFTYQFDWMWSPDMADQVLPWWQEAARQLRHGQVPLWDPHNWIGQPLLGQAQPGVAYPLNWLLWWMPQQHWLLQMWAVNWYFVVVHYMAALFIYLVVPRSGAIARRFVDGRISSLHWSDIWAGRIGRRC